MPHTETWGTGVITEKPGLILGDYVWQCTHHRKKIQPFIDIISYMVHICIYRIYQAALERFDIDNV